MTSVRALTAACVTTLVAALGLTVPLGPPADAAGTGGLTGRVTDTVGAAQEDLDVSLFQAVPGGWAEAATTETDASGSWSLTVPAGTYRLQVEDAFGDYLTQWWRNAATVESATDIAVAEGPAAGGYDVALLADPAAAADDDDADDDVDDDGKKSGKGGKSGTARTLTLMTAPVVKGAAVSGGRLTARPGRATPSAVATYQWLRGARPIKNATRRTYRPVAADVGQKLRVRVTYTRAGYAALTANTRPTPKVRG